MKLTKEECRIEALKYTNKIDFRKNSSVAYYQTIGEKWMHYIAPHFTDIRSRNISYTKSECINEALKYNTKRDFYKKSSSIYRYSLIKGWLPKICSHIKKHKPKNYWTKECCHSVALKYSKYIDFRANNNTAYCVSLKNNWIVDICSHISKFNGLTKDIKYICYAEAFKYNNRSEFAKNSPKLYEYAHKNNLLESIFKHIK